MQQKNNQSEDINKSKKGNFSQVVVYCASSAHIEDIYFDEAKKLGELLAHNKITCITGAGKQGLMGAINDSVLTHGGNVKGVIPQFMRDAGWCHHSLTELVVTNSMHERKQMMAQFSDAAIAMPGGLGTLEELAEVLTWKQLGLYEKPIIILNINGYYDPLLAMFERMVDQKFLNGSYREMWEVVDSAEKVIECLNNFSNWKPSFTKYDKKEL